MNRCVRLLGGVLVAGALVACSSGGGGTSATGGAGGANGGAGGGNGGAAGTGGGAGGAGGTMMSGTGGANSDAPGAPDAGGETSGSSDGPPTAGVDTGAPADECTGGAGPSALPVALAGCATEGQLGFVRDGNIPFVCARGPVNAQKPECLLWRRGAWYLQSLGKVWDRRFGDLGSPCTMAGQRSGFPGGTFLCTAEPGTQALKWALMAGEELLPYVRWSATETFLPLACTPPADTSNGAQFYRAGLSVDPADSNTLYLNIEWIGPFRSKDGGATWAPFNITGRSLPARKTSGAACHGEYPGFAFDPQAPQHLYFIAGGAPGVQGTNAAFQGGSIWKSTDGGGQFQWLGRSELNQYAATFKVLEGGRTLLWGTTSSQGTMTGERAPTPQDKGLLYRSDNFGDTWTELPTGLWPESTASLIWVDPQDPRHIILGIFQYLQRLDGSQARAPGLIKSLDGGLTWAALSGLPAGPRAVTAANTFISRDGNSIFSCGLSNGTGGLGCYRSEDGGTTFGPPLPAFYEVAGDPLDASNQRLVAFRLAGGTPSAPLAAAILQSTDGGKVWSIISPIPTAQPQHFVWDPKVKDRLYLTGESGEVHRLNDAGATWMRLTVYTDFISVPRTD